MSRRLRNRVFGQIRCSGLTLIELMVAMVLSLVLMAGVLTIFAGSKTTYRLQNGLATVQENGRYALHQMVRDIRGAGYTGCAGMEPATINIIADALAGDSYGPSDVVVGFNDVAGHTVVDGVTLEAMPGTDMIRIRGAADSLVGVVQQPGVGQGAEIKFAKGNVSIEQGAVLMVSDCTSADVFCVTNDPKPIGGGEFFTASHAQDCNSANKLSKIYAPPAGLFLFRSTTYFIGDTGRTTTENQPIRALFRHGFNKTTGIVETVELVDGIEDMQITYGVSDSPGASQVVRFVDADQADAGSLWPNVLTVRLSLLVNSVENAHTDVVTYNFNGAASTSVAPDFRLRQEMTSMVALRNRVD